MAIKIEMLRVFAVVAEHGTLTKAAQALGRTPSAISMTLGQLEEHIGAPLFESERKNRLTPLGILILAEANRATDALDRSTEAIRRHVMSIAGTVRIAAVPSATITLLPQAIANFRKQRPDVRLEISDVDSAAVRRRVRLDEADIGIVSSAPGNADYGEPILRDDLGIVHSADGPIARALETTPDSSSWELMELEPLIANPLCRLVANGSIEHLLETCNLEARNTTALLSFVRGGLGATILPYSAIAGTPEELEFVAPTNPLTRRELRKIRSDERHLSPVAQMFWEALPTLG